MLKSLVMLKGGKAPGPDGLPTNLAKDAVTSIANPLIIISNACLTIGIVQNVWKFTKFTPIFNSGTQTEKINFRPILVVNFCKVT